jgi:hypothetical protein
VLSSIKVGWSKEGERIGLPVSNVGSGWRPTRTPKGGVDISPASSRRWLALLRQEAGSAARTERERDRKPGESTWNVDPRGRKWSVGRFKLRGGAGGRVNERVGIG